MSTFDKYSHYFKAEEWLSGRLDIIKRPVHTWRKWLRRLYVGTWPVSLVVRWSIFLMVAATWLVAVVVTFITILLVCKWRGERSPWD